MHISHFDHNIKDKQSWTLVEVVRTDCSQQDDSAMGKSVPRELNSTSICAEVPGCLKGRMREEGEVMGGTAQSEK